MSFGREVLIMNEPRRGGPRNEVKHTLKRQRLIVIQKIYTRPVLHRRDMSYILYIINKPSAGT